MGMGMELRTKKFIAVVVVGFLVIVALFKLLGKSFRGVFLRRGKAIQIKAPDGIVHGRCPDIEANLAASAPVVLTFPMEWYSEAGEFRITFKLGSDSITAVVDTGSEYLIVGAQDCTGCDSKQGVYNSSSSTGVFCPGGAPSVAYGSQVDDIAWYIDDFSAGNSDKSRIEFGVVTKVESAQSKNMNIIGLATSLTYAEKTPFLDQLICTQQVTLPYMYFDFKSMNIEFCIGQPHPNVNSGSVMNFVLTNELQGEGISSEDISYYFLKPNKFSINGTTMQTFPKYCMFDTGTTLLQVSTKISNEMLQQERQTMIMDFGTFQWPYYIDQNTMQVMDDFGDDICILGNQNMVDRIWSFDLAEKTITVIE